METLKNNWLLLAGAFIAWRWYVSDKAGVPLGFGVSHPFTAEPAALRKLYDTINTQPGIVVPIPGGPTVTIDGEIVKIL